MAHYLDLDFPPPPPAYSEQEFDQKISLASQLSLNSHQDHVEREDEWETWDEVAFEEAAARMQRLSLQGNSGTQEAGRTSTSANRHPIARTTVETRPLQIHKKNLSGGGSSVPSSKPKPSWLVEAESDTSGASTSRTFPPLAAPAYTPSASVPLSEPSSAPLTPVSALTNPYGPSEWGPISPVPSLPDPRPEQEEQSDAHSDVPPPLTDESLPPPPFSPDNQRQFLDSHPETSATHASPAMSATLVPGPPSTRGSSPAYSPNPDTNPNLEHTPSTTQQTYLQPQQHLLIPSQLRSGAVLYPTSSLPRHSMMPPTAQAIPPSQSGPPSNSNPGRSQGYNSSRTTTNFTPQTTQAPRINVDLSTVYGKRSTVAAVQNSVPPQVFDASAFYNSVVSAHLGSTNLKPAVNSVGPRRQSHQPPSAASMYNFPQVAQSMPGRYGLPSIAPVQDAYSTRPYNPTPQNPFIRSPTPTYPAGHTTNPMPQMLAAANEGNYSYSSHYLPAPSYPAGQGSLWAEPSNSYR